MPTHPFDERSSGKNPFPCFLESMRRRLSTESIDSQASDSGSSSDGGGRCSCTDRLSFCACEPAARKPLPTSLNWSIDGLATLLPIEFSPLPSQRSSSIGTASSSTSQALPFTPLGSRSATFFDDEDQFRVLLTPQELVDAEQQASTMAASSSVPPHSDYARWRAADGMRLRDLHRRCVETMQFCETRVRERQHKLARLQLPPSKLKLRRREASGSGDGSTSSTPLKHKTRPPQTAREPATPVVATRLSFSSIDLSPIPVDSAEKMRRQAMLSTPSSLSFATPTGPRADPSFTFSTPPEAASSPTSSPFTEADEETKGDDNDKHCSPSTTVSSSIAGSSPSLLSPPVQDPPPASDVRTQQAKSIAQRQLSFVAAIEEEARARDEENETQSFSPPSVSPVLPATSMASIYSEARAMGITEPTAQWEYVQLISRQQSSSSSSSSK